jgi:hypothetical protein
VDIRASHSYNHVEQLVRREGAMMRLRIVFLAMTLTLALVGGAVAGKKQKVGTVKENLYTDNLYGFTFQAFDNWKFAGIDKEDTTKPKQRRFVLVQKNYHIPTRRGGNQENYTPPTLGLWVDTSSLPIDTFAVEIADRKTKLKARKLLAKDFPLLRKGNFEQQGAIQIGGANGIIQKYRMEYEAQLYNRATDYYSVIEELLLGDLYIVEKDGRMFVFYFRAERENYPIVNEEVKKMILSMDFEPSVATEEEEESEE